MKKGMKKILSAAIVLAMTMSLAACGGGTKETQGSTAQKPEIIITIFAVHSVRHLMCL